MTVTVDRVGTSFRGAAGTVEALTDVSLRIADHEFVCLVGPRGCGKTTLLKVVPGLLAPDSGTVALDDVVGVTGRHSALVFQDHGLFPWMSVLDNVAFPLEVALVGRRERRERALQLIASVDLEPFAQAYPHELSGGMQQRVGIARHSSPTRGCCWQTASSGMRAERWSTQLGRTTG